MEKLPVVCIFGVKNIKLESPGPIPHFETNKLDCRCYLTDDDLYAILAKDRPGTIISFGEQEDFPMLMSSPFDVRKRWINFKDTDDLATKGGHAFMCYIQNALNERRDFPLVTVFTPAFRTGRKIMRPFGSLQAQVYKDWEWVIFDDSDDDGETFKMLQGLAESDYRVRVFRESKHSGVIGRVKRQACMVGRGDFLVEMDHDDELTPDALARVVSAFQKHPEAGFVYTDFTECFESGAPVSYGKGWGFSYGSYRKETHNGHEYMVVNAPNINPKTMRHIVASPNHIRAWRASVYRELGGHADLVHVADDYELMVRTFLRTRMVRVPHMCYVQYRNDEGNTHRVRNQEIQRLVRYFSQWYDQAIHDRFVELGVDDFIWKEGESSFIRLNSVDNPKVEPHCTITAE